MIRAIGSQQKMEGNGSVAMGQPPYLRAQMGCTGEVSFSGTFVTRVPALSKFPSVEYPSLPSQDFNGMAVLSGCYDGDCSIAAAVAYDYCSTSALDVALPCGLAGDDVCVDTFLSHVVL